MPISSGSYTLGPSGDFTSFASIAAAINGTVSTINFLSGNLTFTMNGNISEGGFTTFQYINMNGYTLKFTSDTPHLGRANASWKSSVVSVQFDKTIQGSGLFYLEDIYLESTNFSTIINVQGAVRICKSLFSNTRNPFGRGAVAVQSPTIEISDSKFWAFTGGVLIVGNKTASGFTATQTIKLENLSVWGNPNSSEWPTPTNLYMLDIVYASDTANSFVNNCISFTSGVGHGFTFPPFTGDPAIPQSANAGNGGNQGQAPDYNVSSADFTSLNVSNNNFMDTDPGSSLYTLGVAATIACNPRSSPYPIGTIAFVAAVNPPGIPEKQYLYRAALRYPSKPFQKPRNEAEYIRSPLRSHVVPDSTANLSHARILKGYRNLDDASIFHTIMKEAS